VCGGLGALLGINTWWVRGAFVLLSVISLGAFVVPYLLLWWLSPLASPMSGRRRGASWLPALLLLALTIVAWAARDQGWLRAPNGADLFYPAAALLLGGVFFLRQLGGRV
jgi:phage shock protein PspC (stress-responsive transcriptional regulator)